MPGVRPSKGAYYRHRHPDDFRHCPGLEGYLQVLVVVEFQQTSRGAAYPGRHTPIHVQLALEDLAGKHLSSSMCMLDNWPALGA